MNRNLFLKITLSLSIFFTGHNIMAEDKKTSFFDNLEVGQLCAQVNIFVPKEDVEASPVKKEDKFACQWTFSAVSTDGFGLANFGVFLVKDKLKDTERKRFAEFIINEYTESNNRYIKFLDEKRSDFFFSYEFEVGLKGADYDRISEFNSTLLDVDEGTLFIYSIVPKIFKSKESVKLKNGEIIEIKPQMKEINDFISFWYNKNLDNFHEKYK
ncbi:MULTISPECIES: hypothetical protein [Rhizobium/Agrobacterium group]|uniref:hypothetical protein n=1 Tax=Rhizobium/Agrobacterium group TaxID=227290 RepID=UPI000B3FAEAC|nr:MULTISPECIES: hypothetical protein [Rhizobium/Agrobacterium group]MCF1482795.1 hypothetical protein [Allorhizobium ampelinum]NSZ43563.1 hypothetical protein [Agrobacterium vitis]NTA27220.1 hypothetical protein [Allorhizobium ampelinum]OVE94293.1 hypothetical protein B7W85_12025 [Allorhizobium ampelinum]